MENYESREQEVRERLNELLKEKGITQNAVASGDSAAQKRINSHLSHGKGISLDTLLRIIDACPDVSLDWLLRGSGDMVIDNSTHHSITGAGSVNGENNTVIGQQTLSENFVRELLAEKDRQIQTLLNLLSGTK